jgi:hypothetical protein
MKDEGKKFTEKEIKYKNIYAETLFIRSPADSPACIKMASSIET